MRLHLLKLGVMNFDVNFKGGWFNDEKEIGNFQKQTVVYEFKRVVALNLPHFFFLLIFLWG